MAVGDSVLTTESWMQWPRMTPIRCHVLMRSLRDASGSRHWIYITGTGRITRVRRKQHFRREWVSKGMCLWQINVIPFGLCNAPVTFERLMEQVLQRPPTQVCLVYICGWLYTGKSLQRSHLLNISATWWHEVNLKLAPEKNTAMTVTGVLPRSHTWEWRSIH